MNNEKDVSETIEMMRHSCSHVMAEAVQELFPGTKLGIGPAIANGFYYDFVSEHRFTPEDLPVIEAKMREIIKARQSFVRSERSKAEAKEYFAQRGEVYKVELVEELEDGTITFYTNGSFTDLCRGPHLPHTGYVKHFKLTHTAGAYWRGDEKRQMMQRIYGLAFSTKVELDAYQVQQEEALKRDHRKLGQQLSIYMFADEVGPGLPLWLPNGTVIIDELEKLAKETEDAAGFQRVKTPHICKESMYLRSGHLPYYQDSMFPPMDIDGVKYYLKPMNCPHHHMIYGAAPKSYRDLPVRLSEYGTVYRYEQSGELFGLMRVRSMQMNDAHIYCTIQQFPQEFLAVCKMYLDYFKLFGIEKYMMRYSTHTPDGLGKKYVNAPELWQKTEEMVLHTLKTGGINYTEVAGEAAFYGPKIDVEVWSAIGREFTLATNQVDFAVPERFNLKYMNNEGKEETPICIHRAPLGTHERFIGFLIEHFAGAFPLWLSPVQIKILTVNNDQNEYAESVFRAFKQAGLRAELDIRNEKIGFKIRESVVQKVPYMAIIGSREAEGKQITLRLRSGKNVESVPLETAVSQLVLEMKEKRLRSVFE